MNGRYVKSPMISKSLEDAYRDFTMQHKFPFAVLHFHVDGEQIDVNVHPTKMELRFQRQQDVYNTVFEGVHRRLLEPELIQQAEVPDPVAADAKKGAEARTAKESPFLLKPRTPGNVTAGACPVSRPAVPDAGKHENSEASESPVVQTTAGVPARSGEKNEASQESKEEVRDEDYFIRKMRERVMAYHNRASSAEVSDKAASTARRSRQTVSGKRRYIMHSRQKKPYSRNLSSLICLRKIS